jgi:hypothetical protein
MRRLITASFVLTVCGHAFYSQMIPNNVGVPKPTVDLTAGTWKYNVKTVQPDGTYLSTYSIAIKDDSGVWTVTGTWNTPDGAVTDISTLEKNTLILRKESFKHFPKRGQAWKPVTINLDFTANKVTGNTTNVSGHQEPLVADLGGPVFAHAASWIGCLPLADGYSTTFRDFNVLQRRAELMQLIVVGMERVAVPAGTFDSYKVELSPVSGGSDKQTVWIAKDSHLAVKVSEVEVSGGGTILTTTELVP